MALEMRRRSAGTKPITPNTMMGSRNPKPARGESNPRSAKIWNVNRDPTSTS